MERNHFAKDRGTLTLSAVLMSVFIQGLKNLHVISLSRRESISRASSRAELSEASAPASRKLVKRFESPYPVKGQTSLKTGLLPIINADQDS